jgi:hypothetical protein
MTLDEARAQLGVTAAASVEEIRDAFRRRARELHPDLHPHADDAMRARLGQEFSSAREARDILVRYTTDPLRKPASQHPSPPNPEPSRPTREEPSPRAQTTTAPPRVTMRFDEFVAWTDAAGFGPGVRSPLFVDWTRIIVWSTLGVIIAGVIGAMLYLALG